AHPNGCDRAASNDEDADGGYIQLTKGQRSGARRESPAPRVRRTGLPFDVWSAQGPIRRDKSVA
ncbi:MAG: hypothetical protein AAGP08_05770, partial [Pseudomonadota bacterium]